MPGIAPTVGTRHVFWGLWGGMLSSMLDPGVTS